LNALQIQPHCIQLSHPGGGSVLEDFIAGQEASIEQYGLQAQAAGKGLEVQLRLEEGSARVQALIHQETDLVKQELLSTRLTTPAAANAAGQLNTSAHLGPVASFWMNQLTVVRSLTLIWMAASH
jgi:hypothetical protein